MDIKVNQNIKYILYTYFTSFPYAVYNESTQNGNFGFAGIGLGLINVQKLFWTSNLCTTVLIWKRNDVTFYYMNLLLFILCSFLYIKSFTMTLDLIRYFK